jgi:hypothetical protein
VPPHVDDPSVVAPMFDPVRGLSAPVRFITVAFAHESFAGPASEILIVPVPCAVWDSPLRRMMRSRRCAPRHR